MYHTPTAGDWSLYCSVLVYLTFVPRGGSSELVMCMVISLYQQLFICSLTSVLFIYGDACCDSETPGCN